MAIAPGLSEIRLLDWLCNFYPDDVNRISQWEEKDVIFLSVRQTSKKTPYGDPISDINRERERRTYTLTNLR